MKYSLLILNNDRELHKKNDNVDIEIRLEGGQLYSATLFSIENIATIMTNYQETGECLSGAYFWASDMIIVTNFEVETINNIVKELVESGEYKHACSRIE